MRIGLDVSGGDFAPKVNLEGLNELIIHNDFLGDKY